jgi:hypothetical protein
MVAVACGDAAPKNATSSAPSPSGSSSIDASGIPSEQDPAPVGHIDPLKCPDDGWGCITGVALINPGRPAPHACVFLGLDDWDAKPRMKDTHHSLPRRVQTDELGRYRFTGLGTGDFIVHFGEGRGPVNANIKKGELDGGCLYVDTYYERASTEEEATPVHVTKGRTTTLHDVTLTVAAQITGRVLGRNGEPFFACVLLYRGTGSERRRVFQADYTDERGYYQLRELPAGTYRVFFEDCRFDDERRYGSEYHHDALSFGAAQLIELKLGDHEVIDARLDRMPDLLAERLTIGEPVYSDPLHWSRRLVLDISNIGEAASSSDGFVSFVRFDPDGSRKNLGSTSITSVEPSGRVRESFLWTGTDDPSPDGVVLVAYICMDEPEKDADRSNHAAAVNIDGSRADATRFPSYSDC